MAEIKLINSDKVALVDDEDLSLVSKFKWSLKTNKDGYFYVRSSTGISLHQLVTGFTGKRDHKDGNTLNNCRDNLRLCTLQQNNCNRKKSIGCSSKFKGVRFHRNKWSAQITINRKQIHIGSFLNEKDAALAYDLKAKELHGEFARLNSP